MTCNKKLDIVLVIDGSGSLGQKGWDAQINAAERLVGAFDVANAQANVAVVVYSGPWGWWDRWRCMNAGSSVNMESVCKIRTVVEMGSVASKDMAGVKKTVKGLKWPSGMTFTSLALSRAKKQLEFGRANTQGVVVVFTDGKPYSKRRTLKAAKDLRKTARLVWVPIQSKVPNYMEVFGKLATRRPEENIVPVKDFNALHQPAVVNHILADICPHSLPR